MEPLTRSILDSAGAAVELAIGLVGAMAFFLGLMRVGQDAGLLGLIARGAHPVLRVLFPGIPPGHPAMSAMVLNIGSNLLGLGNAATPFGLKAMEELDRLNGDRGTATDSMVLFLAINASGLAILPTSVVALRAAAGSRDPAGILVTTWVASGCATVVAVTSALLLARLPWYRRTAPREEIATSRDAADVPPAAGRRPPTSRPWATRLAGLWGIAFVAALTLFLAREGPTPPSLRSVASYWILPGLVGGIVLHGWSRGVAVWGSLVEGAKEGFDVAIRIIPYLVAVLVAVGMFRASGALDLFVRAVDPVTRLAGMPAEALPMAILRPLSGSGSFAVMGEIVAAHGPDSFLGYLVSTLQGSTETTFYVLAVYFGAVGVKRTRQTLPACLLGDAAGMLASVGIVRLMLG